MSRFAVALGALLLSAPGALAAPVVLKASDGAAISADHTGKGERGVVLVHGSSGTRADWASLQKRLDDVQVVAVDLRGYGASKGERNAVASVADVAAAVAHLRARGAKKIVVVGAGLGGNLALAAAAADQDIESVVMLSPALNADGVKASAALPSIRNRPVWMLAGEDDQLATKAANLLADNLANARVDITATGGSGMAILHREADVEGSLVAWIHGAYGVAGGDLTPQTRTSTSTEGFQTTGTKLGER